MSGTGSSDQGQNGAARPYHGPAAGRPHQPDLSVGGNPSAAELAAVVAVLAGAARLTGAPAAGAARSEWPAASRRVRAPLAPSPGGWRASALPR
jgi:hypothetical protein